MQIERYIKRISQHTAVYWSTPVAAADGSNTYAAPVEISCFWKEGFRENPDRDMKIVSAKAVVYVSQDLDEQGMLFKGTLNDLTTAQKADPRKVSRAYTYEFVKTPSLHLKGKYNRMAIIAPEKATIPRGIGR